MRYQISDGTVRAGSTLVLEHFDFQIRSGEKLALTGPNGAGKTTLLRLIDGELSLDRDDRRRGPGIIIEGNPLIRMLHQQPFADLDQTAAQAVLQEERSAADPYGQTGPADKGESMPAAPDRTGEEVWSREQFECEQAFLRAFTAMGFRRQDQDKRLCEFSGGERTKIALIQILLQKADILLLDEPTNHLDFQALEWLEEQIRSYPGAVVLVSHDRFFLDETVQAVYAFEGKKLRRYSGGYSDYCRQRAALMRKWIKQYQEQEQEARRLEGLIRKFSGRPRKAVFARSRKKILERMDRIGRPQQGPEYIFTGSIDPLTAGPKWVLSLDKLCFGYDRPLMEISLRVRRGQKIGILGANGVGKSTLLKTLAGLLRPLSGSFLIPDKLEVGYFDQHSARLLAQRAGDEQTVLSFYRSAFPNLSEKDARTELAHYLFRGASAMEKVSALSGGESARLALALLLGRRPGMLLLDEPTNHMDIPARETLESAFGSYTGTILFVSHDRYFIEQVADCLLILEDGKALYYPFGYRHYIKRQRELAGQKGKGAAARIEAENMALVEGLRSVPKGSSLQSRQLSDDEAFYEWRLGLAQKKLDVICSRIEELQSRLQEMRDYSLLQFCTGEKAADEPELEQIQAALTEIYPEFTRAALQWYDVMQDAHPED